MKSQQQLSVFVARLFSGTRVHIRTLVGHFYWEIRFPKSSTVKIEVGVGVGVGGSEEDGRLDGRWEQLGSWVRQGWLAGEMFLISCFSSE